MPEPVEHVMHVGAHAVTMEHWACRWCGWEAADRAAVVRHEDRCPQRDDALW